MEVKGFDKSISVIPPPPTSARRRPDIISKIKLQLYYYKPNAYAWLHNVGNAGNMGDNSHFIIDFKRDYGNSSLQL